MMPPTEARCELPRIFHRGSFENTPCAQFRGQDMGRQLLDQRQLHIRGSFGQPSTEPQLRMFCICAAMCPGGRGLKSAGVSARVKGTLDVSSTKASRSLYTDRVCKEPGRTAVMNYGPMTIPCTGSASENSEVSPVFLLVAVAVITRLEKSPLIPKAKGEGEALPCLLVLTCICPRKVSPSPKPEGSFTPESGGSSGLEKNWMMKTLFFFLVLGVLFSVPFIKVEPPNVWAEVM